MAEVDGGRGALCKAGLGRRTVYLTTPVPLRTREWKAMAAPHRHLQDANVREQKTRKGSRANQRQASQQLAADAPLLPEPEL
jgi:hypothetical protein